MGQYRSRLKLSENFENDWSIRILGEIHMDQSLVHTFSWGTSYGPMVLKVLLKFPPTLALVHGWLFPEEPRKPRKPRNHVLKTPAQNNPLFGRLIFIHHQCWEVLPFCRFQRQRCIKILCPEDPDFYTPLGLKTAKGQHLPALCIKISLPLSATLELHDSNRSILNRPILDSEADSVPLKLLTLSLLEP